MKIINFGSINHDQIYHVPHWVHPGETISSTWYGQKLGGKGLNQSVAATRAGAQVLHVGHVGDNGAWIVQQLKTWGVNTQCLHTHPSLPTGHAVIQVLPSGENAILLHAGANHALSESHIETALSHAEPHDMVLLQNETSAVDTIMARAHTQGLPVMWNPAPMPSYIPSAWLDDVTCLMINEVEASTLTGTHNPEEGLHTLQRRHPHLSVLLSLGAEGAVYYPAQGAPPSRVQAPQVTACDTTAAGDTLIGYWLAGLQQGKTPHASLIRACHAASLSVTRHGAAESIPSSQAVAQAFNWSSTWPDTVAH